MWQSLTWWQDRRPKVLIEWCGSSITDRARVTDGGTRYTVNVAIINQSPRTPKVILGMALDAPWDRKIEILSDPRDDVPPKQHYRLNQSEKLPRERVINHGLYEEGRLDVGGVM